MQTGFWEKIVMAIIVLHFIVGFGYLIYKLSPRKEENMEETESESNAVD
jgi:hypothetical protein